MILSPILSPISSTAINSSYEAWIKLSIDLKCLFNQGVIHILATSVQIDTDQAFQRCLVPDCGATYDVSEARFYFQSDSGRLVALELFPDPDTDPCEIFFSDFRDTDAGELPHRWEVRHGNRVFAVITFKTFTLPPSVEKDA